MRDLEAKRKREYEERKRYVFIRRRLNFCRYISLKDQQKLDRINDYPISYDALLERAKKVA